MFICETPFGSLYGTARRNFEPAWMFHDPLIME
jgi:hypothetical protein